jgi:hypothetical protein
MNQNQKRFIKRKRQQTFSFSEKATFFFLQKKPPLFQFFKVYFIQQHTKQTTSLSRWSAIQMCDDKVETNNSAVQMVCTIVGINRELQCKQHYV